MTSPKDPSIVGITPSFLHSLHQSLERVLEDHGAQLLQEAGFASGGEVYRAFQAWLQDRTDVQNPKQLDAAFLGEVMSDFFVELGWGRMEVERVGQAALSILAPGWAEASTSARTEVPSCHITTGLFAALLGELAGAAVAVMEVECRTCGDPACRFLVGAPETLQVVFEGMSQGSDYRGVLAAAGSAD